MLSYPCRLSQWHIRTIYLVLYNLTNLMIKTIAMRKLTSPGKKGINHYILVVVHLKSIKHYRYQESVALLYIVGSYLFVNR